MLEPSIDSLQEKIDSKYSIATIVARRARELREKQNFAIEEPRSGTYVGIALEEIIADKLKIVEDD